MISRGLLSETIQFPRWHAVIFQAGTSLVDLGKTASSPGDYEMVTQKLVVAVYPTHTKAAQAVREPQHGE